jgi:hypothetical protein
VITLTVQSSTFLRSIISLSHPYGVYIYQFIRYAIECFAYEKFPNRGQLLTKKVDAAGFSFKVNSGPYADIFASQGSDSLTLMRVSESEPWLAKMIR